MAGKSRVWPRIPQTINGLVAHAVKAWPDRPYLLTRSGETVRVRSYGEVLRDATDVAGGLIGLGVQPGERVALLAENRPEWIGAYLAILLAGATVVPVDSLMSSAEIASILKMAQARLLITTKKFAAALAQAGGDEAQATTLLMEADAAPEHAVPRRAGVPLPEVQPADVAAVIFTSGTTGFSKGVVLTHGNLCTDAQAVLEADILRVEDNFHLLLPLHHTYSSTVNMTCCLALGGRSTFAASYKSRDILDDIRVAQVTILVGVPQVFENIMHGMRRAVGEASLLRRALFHAIYGISAALYPLGIRAGRPLFRSLRAKAGMESLGMMISGGAALQPAVNRFFERLGFTLLQGYGLTETSPVISVNLPRRNRIGSVGLPLHTVEFRIDSPDADGVGEICVRGPMVMQGYFENPAATADVLRDGWFHTGDVGRVDGDGFVFITGRLKNVIVTGAGKNVHPEEIESRLNASPYVQESLVKGMERKKGAGEELEAILVPDNAAVELARDQGHPVDVRGELEKVIEAYNHSVPAYRRIRQWTMQEEELAKTSTRKVRRYLYRTTGTPL